MSSYLDDMQKIPSRGCAQVLVNINNGVSPYASNSFVGTSEDKAILYRKFTIASTDIRKRIMKSYKLDRASLLKLKRVSKAY